MELNSDFSQRVVVDTATEPWVASPLPGVDRRMLDRIGGEVARATSIVRYAPNSYFAPHDHGGGEEFLVIDGVFSDEHGDYGPGMYVRNPPGSRHQPFSRDGCTIFVKLWQMAPDDRAFVRTDTRIAAWRPGPGDGVEVVPLAERAGERVMLMRLRPGTALPTHDHPGGEELLVLDGVLADERGRYRQGTWLRNPPGSAHAPFSQDGCTFWLKLGHLAGEITGPPVATA